MDYQAKFLQYNEAASRFEWAILINGQKFDYFEVYWDARTQRYSLTKTTKWGGSIK